MEIDLGTIIIGIVFILICITPLIIMHINKIRKNNKMLHLLAENAEKNNCKISQYEFYGDFVLGKDNEKDFVFFLKQNSSETTFQSVDLNEIQACKVAEKARSVKNNKDSTSIIEKLELCFIPKNKDKGETKFELFNELNNVQLTGELQLADKWSKQINTSLRSKK